MRISGMQVMPLCVVLCACCIVLFWRGRAESVYQESLLSSGLLGVYYWLLETHLMSVWYWSESSRQAARPDCFTPFQINTQTSSGLHLQYWASSSKISTLPSKTGLQQRAEEMIVMHNINISTDNPYLFYVHSKWCEMLYILRSKLDLGRWMNAARVLYSTI